MAEETGKRGLGRFSVFVYPILAALFVYIGITYEFKRIDLMGLSSGNGIEGELYTQWKSLRNEFLLIMSSIVLAVIVWSTIVIREKRKYPERYRKY